jgi:hypothetical protein
MVAQWRSSRKDSMNIGTISGMVEPIMTSGDFHGRGVQGVIIAVYNCFHLNRGFTRTCAWCVRSCDRDGSHTPLHHGLLATARSNNGSKRHLLCSVRSDTELSPAPKRGFHLRNAT